MQSANRLLQVDHRDGHRSQHLLHLIYLLRFADLDYLLVKFTMLVMAATRTQRSEKGGFQCTSGA